MKVTVEHPAPASTHRRLAEWPNDGWYIRDGEELVVYKEGTNVMVLGQTARISSVNAMVQLYRPISVDEITIKLREPR